MKTQSTSHKSVQPYFAWFDPASSLVSLSKKNAGFWVITSRISGTVRRFEIKYRRHLHGGNVKPTGKSKIPGLLA
jgi:hypothetical protein